jgi:hypothetical protein
MSWICMGYEQNELHIKVTEQDKLTGYVNNQLKSVYNKLVMTWFYTMTRNLPGWPDDNQQKPWSGQPVSTPASEAAISQIRQWIVKTLDRDLRSDRCKIKAVGLYPGFTMFISTPTYWLVWGNQRVSYPVYRMNKPVISKELPSSSRLTVNNSENPTTWAQLFTHDHLR